jgi:hypothetical protein
LRFWRSRPRIGFAYVRTRVMTLIQGNVLSFPGNSYKELDSVFN